MRDVDGSLLNNQLVLDGYQTRFSNHSHDFACLLIRFTCAGNDQPISLYGKFDLASRERLAKRTIQSIALLGQWAGKLGG